MLATILGTNIVSSISITRWRYRACWINWMMRNPTNSDVSWVRRKELLPVFQTLQRTISFPNAARNHNTHFLFTLAEPPRVMGSVCIETSSSKCPCSVDADPELGDEGQGRARKNLCRHSQ